MRRTSRPLELAVPRGAVRVHTKASRCSARRREGRPLARARAQARRSMGTSRATTSCHAAPRCRGRWVIEFIVGSVRADCCCSAFCTYEGCTSTPPCPLRPSAELTVAANVDRDGGLNAPHSLSHTTHILSPSPVSHCRVLPLCRHRVHHVRTPKIAHAPIRGSPPSPHTLPSPPP